MIDGGLINDMQVPTFVFKPNSLYRLRILGLSAFVSFNFWLDGHDMRLIEIDGVCIFFFIPISKNIFNVVISR
jgi:FtsP/CotA-like multicopper oxidase with cupredoxin domain